MSRTRALAALAVVPLIVLAAACGDDGGKASEPSADVTVAAAPAVSARLKPLVEGFMADNPDVSVSLAREDHDEMLDSVKDKSTDIAVMPDVWLEDPSDAPDPLAFATNSAIIVVPKGNPKNITGLDAFKDGTSLRTQVCATPTPAGTFILMVLEKAGVTPAPDTVAKGCEKDAAQAVADGKLDAATMYRFGVKAPEGAEIVPVAPEVDLPFSIGTYVLSDDDNVRAFVKFLTSPNVRKRLDAGG